MKHTKRALNAFDAAVEGEESVGGRAGRNERITLSEEPDSNDELTNGDVSKKDDEEIDSDEALGTDDDNEEFMGRYNSRKEDNSDNEEGYDSIDESELLPLSEVWDLNEKRGGNDDDESDDEDGNDLKLNQDDEDESSAESSSSDDDGDDEDESDLSMSDDEDDEEIDEDKLSSLKAQIADMSNAEPIKMVGMSRKERLRVNRVAENEFALPASEQDDLSLADLVSDGTETKKSSSQQGPLAVPLPKRIQERHDRTAAYGLTKDEVEKWSDTVKKNREAEYLQFPMNAPPQVQKNSIYTPMAPSTNLEKNVDQVLKESGGGETETPSTFEELAPAKMSIEEIKKRRNELRLMRELMFRQEQKAKRIKKIKSKSYRKVHKKERERQNQMLEDEEGGSDAEDHDIKRAQERMSLRHKNTGKWAKNMINQGFTKDKETRDELEEMLRRGEDLKKKIEGDDDSDQSDNDDQTFLDAVDNGSADDSEDERNRQSVGKGIMGMKFMRDAEERQRQKNKEDIQSLRDAENETGFEDLDDGNSVKANREINAGRRVFVPGTQDAEDDMIVSLQQAKDDHEEEQQESMSSRISRGFDALETRQEKTVQKKQNKKSNNKNKDVQEEEEESNPWLAIDSSSQPLESAKSVQMIDKDSTSAQKTQDKIRKQKNKTKGSSSAAQDDTIIDMNETLQVVDPLASDEEAEGGDGAGETMVRGRGKLMSFKQKDLVKRAFAGDDVVADFQDEKRRKVEEEGDQELDVTIPGWGSWGGNGAKSKRKVVKKVEGIKEKKRKDAKLKNVIINERVNKKNAKYTASAVPFPFENREQYERSLRMPVGPEWSSRDTHQRLTKPRVLVKQGTVIDPIKAPFKS